MKKEHLTYEEFSKLILKETKNNCTDVEPHTVAIKLIEFTEKYKDYTTLENYLKFKNDNAIPLCDLMLNHCIEGLKVFKSFFEDKPFSNDFNSRYQAYNYAFENLLNSINDCDLKNEISVFRDKIEKLHLSNKSGCYIATMAYGDYNHPQVIILRQFRDDVLDRLTFGKWFIKTYYRYSPKLVELLKNKKTVNNLIRNLLDQLIKTINK